MGIFLLHPIFYCRWLSLEIADWTNLLSLESLGFSVIFNYSLVKWIWMFSWSLWESISLSVSCGVATPKIFSKYNFAMVDLKEFDLICWISFNWFQSSPIIRINSISLLLYYSELILLDQAFVWLMSPLLLSSSDCRLGESREFTIWSFIWVYGFGFWVVRIVNTLTWCSSWCLLYCNWELLEWTIVL